MEEQRDTQPARARPTGRLKRTVVLVGMMGSGKTAIGKALATRVGVDFVDSDQEIESAAAATIAEVFARDGEAFFRDRETEVIRRLLRDGPQVISTGGGAWMSERNRAAITGSAVSVWLDADVPLLWERVRHKSTRPLLKSPDPRGTLQRLHDERAPTYALADLRVKSRASYSIADMADCVVRELGTRPDVLELTDVRD
ncbi:shikimate kinase [Pelagovum pacificum]|uniref:Shikimate kinase n=1 Tax=Pelagovum pacificum TaxID=2588711 RepID=A0A5C5GB39_9RHOB|nr:shikimate kinase [Pelagovum pacificum]QQA44860.1 shikimate kinase [Pelagovum pacificum]TNY32035.1 shikimate kinase [Pelagovum pacificum]